MQEPKMWMLLVTGLIPILIGNIWFSKFAFGNIWQRESKVGNQRPTLKGIALMMLSLYFIGVLFSAFMMMNVIHQMHLGSLMADPVNGKLLKDPTSKPYQDLSNFINTYGTQFRSFKHGALHGFMTSLIASLAFLGTLCMFEKKSLKYFLIHSGYWIVCGILIGGILCAYA